MVEQRKEATVDISKTLRMLAATAVVSALAILLASPAQAYLPNEGDGGSVAAVPVGNPGDGADVASATIGEPVVTSSGSDGFDTGTLIAFAGGAVLVLGAGALLFTARHRRVALP